MKKSLWLIATLSLNCLPCSNIAIIGNGYTTVARTLDFPVNTGNVIGVGLKGRSNKTDLNLENGAKKKYELGGKLQRYGLRWKNKHDFIGQTWVEGDVILDGINDAGLYAGYLYLPNFTEYPRIERDTKNPNKKLLGISNAINYLLGMADSVDHALQLLGEVKLVPNALYTKLQREPGLYVIVPIHLIIRDKSGNAAVIEWVNGETKIYKKAGPVLTNAPTYGWQVKNAAKYNFVKAGDTNEKFDGACMEGSGFIGLPGDWTPPSRFVRATQLIKHTPKPTSTNDAIMQALSVINTIESPLGGNPSPTLWKSVSDLNNNVYYFYQIYEIQPLYASWGTDKNVTMSSPDLAKAVTKYELSKVNRLKLPVGSKEVALNPSKRSAMKKLINRADKKTACGTAR